jgi:hypothetical protein
MDLRTMDLNQYLRRVLDALEGVHSELEQLRILKEHELGVRIQHAEEGHGPYIPKQPADEE